MYQALARQKQKQFGNFLTVAQGMFHDYLHKNAKGELNSLLKDFFIFNIITVRQEK